MPGIQKLATALGSGAAVGSGVSVFDDLTTLAPYSLVPSSGSGLAVSSGRVPFGSPTSTTKIAKRNGVSVADSLQIVEFKAGASVASGELNFSLLCKILTLGASDVVDAILATGNISSSGNLDLSISKADNGTFTTLQPNTTSGAIAANDTRWFVLRTSGNVIKIELWNTDPRLIGTPQQTRQYTLAGADATKFGAGVAGGVGWRVNSSRSDPSVGEYTLLVPATGGSIA